MKEHVLNTFAHSVVCPLTLKAIVWKSLKFQGSQLYQPFLLVVFHVLLKNTFSVVVVQSLSRVWLCDPLDCSIPGLPVLHYLLEFAQIHVYWVGDASWPSHPLLLSSPFAFNPSQHRGLLRWVGFSHQIAKVLELLLQHQCFLWIFNEY